MVPPALSINTFFFPENLVKVQIDVESLGCQPERAQDVRDEYLYLNYFIRFFVPHSFDPVIERQLEISVGGRL